MNREIFNDFLLYQINISISVLTTVYTVYIIDIFTNSFSARVRLHFPLFNHFSMPFNAFQCLCYLTTLCHHIMLCQYFYFSVDYCIDIFTHSFFNLYASTFSRISSFFNACVISPHYVTAQCDFHNCHFFQAKPDFLLAHNFLMV